HDTFARVFERLDRRGFERCFLNWTRSLADFLGFTHLATDRNALRAEVDDASGVGPLLLVRAWASLYGPMLNRMAMDSASDVPPALPPFLKLLERHGAFTPGDAASGQE